MAVRLNAAPGTTEIKLTNATADMVDLKDIVLRLSCNVLECVGTRVLVDEGGQNCEGYWRKRSHRLPMSIFMNYG